MFYRIHRIQTTRWLARLSATVLGSLLLGLSAGAARASEPTTAAEARAMARASSERAERYRAMGGVAYKTGLVQREELAAARYGALADRLSAPATEPSPEAAHSADLAAHYRRMGGTAYKTGLVQAAEAQEARAAEAPPTPEPSKTICLADKPVTRIACASALWPSPLGGEGG